MSARKLSTKAHLVTLIFLILFALANIYVAIIKLDVLADDFANLILDGKIEVTVIVIGYNRPKSLKRVLSSLERVIIPKDNLNVNLKICLDGSDKATYQVASSHKRTKWFNGKFVLFQREKNYGLAKHITSCWDHPQSKEWALILEDDVVVSPQIFHAFLEALHVRGKISNGRAIQGIAMHGQRVNQYCWKGFVKRNLCSKIHSECKTKNATDSTLGALVCPDPTPPFWIGTQIPSSWGAFYTGHSWEVFQFYYEVWQQLSDAQLTALELPLSMSNEWRASWKRPFAELMYAMGWTFLYRNVDHQKSLISTKRDAGVHTKRNASVYEEESRCLIELPLENSYYQSTGEVSSIEHLDYCSHPVENIQELRKRGLEFVRHMSLLYNNARGISENKSPIHRAIRILRNNYSPSELNKTMSGPYMPPHTVLDRLSAAKVILVTTVHEVNRDFQNFCKHMLNGSVTIIVVGPSPVCIYLRNYESAHCLPETQFVGRESHLPVVTKLLQGGLDTAIPGVTDFVGVINADIVFQGDGLVKTLASVKSKCNANCVVVGKRFDVDWNTKEKIMHSAFGMDFFIFNIKGAQFAVENMPPMIVGRTRWDSYFMGYFVMSPDIEVIDATETLTALHMMDFSKSYASHTHDDLTNHNLATEAFRMGRVDHSNYKTSEKGVEVHRTTRDVAHQFRVHQERYKFDLFLEQSTNFTYSSSALFPYVTCFCALLENPPKQFCESSTLIQHEINQTKHEKAVILPYDSLKPFLPVKNEAFFEELHITSTSAPHFCCFTKHKLPLHSRPRIASMQLHKDYQGPFDILCLHGKSFPFGFKS